ncbi:MAG: cupin domain-containing protein [Alloprevotella sp.]
MNQPSLTKSAAGFSIAEVGELSAFAGKAFLKEILGTTSLELSFGSLNGGESVPFFHHHKQNEEVYVIIAGTGVFSLDGEETELRSGSIVRVAPSVSRRLRATGSSPLVFACIQAKAGSLEQFTATDGVIEE